MKPQPMLASTPPSKSVTAPATLVGEASLTTLADTHPPFAVLNDSGALRDGLTVDLQLLPKLNGADALRLYRGMLQMRLVDDRLAQLHREGRISFYLSSRGDEAMQIGAAFALKGRDFVFPTGRDVGFAFWRGFTIADYVNQLFGVSGDLTKGRQMPTHIAASTLRIASVSSPVGTQIPQAMGVGWAARLASQDDVALVCFGDGACASGEFHIGLNFAGVFKTNTIFLCRSADADSPNSNIAYAVKALAYGVRAVRVDGNDLLAVATVVADAARRARAGQGATMIECVLGVRSGARDPIALWQQHLAVRALAIPGFEADTAAAINAEVDAAIASASAAQPPARDSLFDDVFSSLTPALVAQKAELAGDR